MALKWQYRSDSATRARYASGLADIYQRGVTDPTLTAGPSGTFGGTYLNMAAGPWIIFPGADNAPIGATAISVLWRLVPISSGAPSGNKPLLCLGSSGNFNDNQYGGLLWGVNSSGKMYTIGGTRANGTNYFSPGFYTLTNAFTFVANQPTDIWFTWDGTTNANGVKVYQAQNGNAPTLLEQFTANVAMEAMSREQITEILIRDFWNNSNNNAFHINEICIWDSVEDPTSYGARSDFITAPEYEGYNYTSLAAGNVRNGTAYGPGPGSLTGTLTTPALSDVRAGTDVDGSPGTLVVPDAADVREGTDVDDTQGTLVVPDEGDVRNGTVFDNGSVGTLDNVTNVVAAASLVGQSSEAVLKAAT